MEKEEPATVSGRKDFDSSSVSDDQLYSTLFQFSQSFLPKYDLQMIYRPPFGARGLNVNV